MGLGGILFYFFMTFQIAMLKLFSPYYTWAAFCFEELQQALIRKGFSVKEILVLQEGPITIWQQNIHQ